MGLRGETDNVIRMRDFNRLLLLMDRTIRSKFNKKVGLNYTTRTNGPRRHIQNIPYNSRRIYILSIIQIQEMHMTRCKILS